MNIRTQVAFMAAMEPNDITHEIIGAAIEVHRAIGPGQDEVLYEDAMEVGFDRRGLRFLRQRPLPVHYKGVIEAIIGAAIEVHRHLGPGLLHSVYEACLRHELTLAALSFESGRRVEAVFQGTTLPHRAELELVVAGRILVSTLSVPEILPLHEAQVRSQMHLANLQVGLLLNFHAKRLVDGLRRFGVSPSSVSSETPR